MCATWAGCARRFRGHSGPCSALQRRHRGSAAVCGFYSKDAILAAADRHAPWMYWVGVITAGMTAFYVFRAIFLAFFGEYRGKAHPHESPLVMIGPLAVLAVLSLAGGMLFQHPRVLGAAVSAGQGCRRHRPDAYLGGFRLGRDRACRALLCRQAGFAGSRSRPPSAASTSWSTTNISWMRSTRRWW